MNFFKLNFSFEMNLNFRKKYRHEQEKNLKTKKNERKEIHRK